MAVKVIKATIPNTPSAEESREREELRVAAYCRVSTDSDEQENSYEAQKTHYEAFIRAHEGWNLAGIYADAGISGTSARKRPEFLSLIKTCENGDIDLVLTKSISRFSRNTVDCLKYIRVLKDLSIPVIFEKENINTMDASGELLITILASISQQESASISENVRLGHIYNFQQGKGLFNEKMFFGYDKGPEPHTMVINPEQAVIVRRIYRLYLEGFSPFMIANMLNKEEVPTTTGKGNWYASTITSILSNEKHCGDLLLQKYFTKDFLSHKQVKNKGERPQYYVEDDHEPIVPKEIFYQVQGEQRRRELLKNEANRIRFENALIGRVYCGKCGGKLRRFQRKVTDWRCENRFASSHAADRNAHTVKRNTHSYDGNTAECRCNLGIIKEYELQDAVAAAFSLLPGHLNEILELETSIHDGDIKRIDKMIEAYSTEEEGIDPGEERLTAIQEEKNRLFYKRAETVNHLVLVRSLRELVEHRSEMADDGGACDSFDDFLRRTQYIPPEGMLNSYGEMIKYDNDMVLRFVEAVTVNEDRLMVKFKAGIEIEVGRRKNE